MRCGDGIDPGGEEEVKLGDDITCRVSGQEHTQPIPPDVDVGPVLQLNRCLPDLPDDPDRGVVIDPVVLADPAGIATPAFEARKSLT
jgi:hypothetical protein